MRLEFTTCESCPFFVSPKSCAWEEHAVAIAKEWSESEEDDPITDYYKMIKCVKCGAEITFYTTYSTFSQGCDAEKCPKCGTYHYYQKYLSDAKDGKNCVFIVPLSVKA